MPKIYINIYNKCLRKLDKCNYLIKVNIFFYQQGYKKSAPLFFLPEKPLFFMSTISTISINLNLSRNERSLSILPLKLVYALAALI